MKITTAWAKHGENDFELVASFDTATLAYLGKPPREYMAALRSYRAERIDVREMVVEIPDASLPDLFRSSVVVGTVVPE